MSKCRMMTALRIVHLHTPTAITRAVALGQDSSDSRIRLLLRQDCRCVPCLEAPELPSHQNATKQRSLLTTACMLPVARARAQSMGRVVVNRQGVARGATHCSTRSLT